MAAFCIRRPQTRAWCGGGIALIPSSFPPARGLQCLYPREVPIHVRSLGSTREVSDTGEPRQAGPERRSGADLSASGRGGASRSPCPRHFGAERPSKSFGIYFDSRRTYWFERMAARSYGQTTTVARWAFDFAGGTKPAKPSGPGFLRGALPGRVLFPCWCGRSGGAPPHQHSTMTATDGPLACLTIERHPVRHPALGSAGQHASVDVPRGERVDGEGEKGTQTARSRMPQAAHIRARSAATARAVWRSTAPSLISPFLSFSGPLFPKRTSIVSPPRKALEGSEHCFSTSENYN